MVTLRGCDHVLTLLLLMWEMRRDENHPLSAAGLSNPTMAAWAGVAGGLYRQMKRVPESTESQTVDMTHLDDC